eukprot:m51a1_g6658 putative 3 -cyclic-nucleotide phosphodiesterase (1251) ;mRNA; r:153684-160398
MARFEQRGRAGMLLVLGLELAAAACGVDEARARIRVQLDWMVQAQFAGVVAASALGYFADECLDVTIVGGGEGFDPVHELATDQAQIACINAAGIFAARDSGVDVVLIDQIFQGSATVLVTLKTSGIASPGELRGKAPSIDALMQSVGVARSDYSYKQPWSFGVAGLIKSPPDYDGVAVMSYNELGTLYSTENENTEELYKPSDVNLFYLENYNITMLEDAIVVKRKLRGKVVQLESQLDKVITGHIMGTPAEFAIGVLRDIAKLKRRLKDEEKSDLLQIVGLLSSNSMFKADDILRKQLGQQQYDRAVGAFLKDTLLTPDTKADSFRLPAKKDLQLIMEIESNTSVPEIEECDESPEPTQAFDSWGFSVLSMPRSVDSKRLLRFLNCICSSYDDRVPYHNADHAADVVQAVGVLLNSVRDKAKLTQCELLGAIIASCVHDVGHQGVNNNFLVASLDPIALRYNLISPLENMHAATAIATITRSECNFVAKTLTKDEFVDLIKQVASLVLSTDMTRHVEIVGQFNAMLASSGDADWGLKANRHLLLQVILKFADISNAAREWDVCQLWSMRVQEEFFAQGDREAQQGLPVSPFMSRSETDWPKCQYGFMSFIVEPLAESLERALGPCPAVQEIRLNLKTNLRMWLEGIPSTLPGTTASDHGDSEPGATPPQVPAAFAQAWASFLDELPAQVTEQELVSISRWAARQMAEQSGYLAAGWERRLPALRAERQLRDGRLVLGHETGQGLALPSHSPIVFRRLVLRAVWDTTSSAIVSVQVKKARIRVQLDWMVQAEFAGFVAASALGYFADECLDVTVVGGGEGFDPVHELSSDQAQIACINTAGIFAALDGGLDVVLLDQVFQGSATVLVTLKSSGIAMMSYNELGTLYTTINEETGQLYKPSDVNLFYLENFNITMLEDAVRWMMNEVNRLVWLKGQPLGIPNKRSWDISVGIYRSNSQNASSAEKLDAILDTIGFLAGVIAMFVYTRKLRGKVVQLESQLDKVVTGRIMGTPAEFAIGVLRDVAKLKRRLKDEEKSDLLQIVGLLSSNSMFKADDILRKQLGQQPCVHDVGHQGVNNNFLVASLDPLAIRYSLISTLSKAEFVDLIKQVASLVLSTDMTRHVEIVGQFNAMLASSGDADWGLKANRHLLLQVILKFADISNAAREWDVCQLWSMRVQEEFFAQGDREAQQGLPVSPFMSRSETDWPKCQYGFMSFIVEPLAESLERALGPCPAVQEIRLNIKTNLRMWLD